MAARSEKKGTKTPEVGRKKAAPKASASSTKKASAPKAVKTKKAAAPKTSSSPKKTVKKAKPPVDRHAALKQILIEKREALIQEIKQQLGQSVTDEQQRRLEAAMDSGDQALVDLEREMGISLQEMRNRERQLIDDALDSLDEGTYGMCAECGEEISEKRLQALPFARLCVACQSQRELMEKIERAEQRL